jgi:hypothetical protein
MVVPDQLMAMILNDDPIMEALAKHIAVSVWSLRTYTAEKTFLAEHFPEVPNIDERLERIMGLGSSGAVATVWSAPDKLERLKRILAGHRIVPADLALAAACQWTAEELEFLDDWFLAPMEQDFRETCCARSFSQLLTLLDLKDPAGRLSVETIVGARRTLGNDLGAGGAPRWSHARIDALLHAILGEEVPHKVFATGGKSLVENESWRFGVAVNNGVPYAERNGTATQSGTLDVGALQSAFTADALTRGGAEARRRLRRCLLKAAGVS